MPPELEHRPESHPAERSTAARIAHAGRRLLARLCAFDATQVELHERLLLLNQPWKEELLHWSDNGHQRQLHGHLAPPADGRRRSVTRGGWCPGCRTTPPS